MPYNPLNCDGQKLQMDNIDRFHFELYEQKELPLRKYFLLAVALHVAIVLIVSIYPLLFKQRELKSSTPYLFEMVSPQPVVRLRTVQPKLKSVTPTATDKPKIVKMAKAERSWEKKAKPAERESVLVKEEIPMESPGWEEVASSTPTESHDKTVDHAQTEMILQGPAFPYNYYLAQIRNAIEGNWRQTPRELLGSEERLAVVVKFVIVRSGKINEVEIIESSWNSLLDKFALRAIEKAKIPPLPAEYSELPVRYRLVLERGK